MRTVLGQTRLLITSALLLAMIGLASWLTMPRQEDPDLKRRFGLITVAFPGADAGAVERLVVEPIEEEIAEVDQIKRLESRSRAGFAVINLEFRDDTSDFDKAWDEVEEAVERAQPELPDGAQKPDINRDTIDQHSVVLAVRGSADPLVLADAAESIKRGLLSVGSVSSVDIIADPGEQITIEYDEATANRLGIAASTLAAQLGARNITPAGGTVRVGPRVASLRPATEFRSLEELRSTPIVLPSGSTVPLGEVARVRLGPTEPVAEHMRVDGETAVGIGIVAREGINLVAYGEAVRERVAQLEPQVAPLSIDVVAFQPDHVQSRTGDLGRSLLLGVGIVAIVLFVAMGARLGLVVASVVPLVALTALGIYALGGGILHQISIAALVIALGMLVDNAIVVAENVQSRIDLGEDPGDAARNAVRELLVPLGVATGTTLAAFIPMLLAEGGTADFTRALPIVIMLTLTASYVYAVFITPALSRVVLRPSRAPSDPPQSPSLFERVAARLGDLSVRRNKTVLIGAVVAVALALAGASRVEQRFFPSSDRNTVIVDLALPEGSHLSEVDRLAQGLERDLAEHPRVQQVAAFVGRGAPHFYYNLLQKPGSPHLAQLVVTTTDREHNNEVIAFVRDQAQAKLAGVEVVAKGLEQGPPITAPVEVRLTGDDLGSLREAADIVSQRLRTIHGAADVRDDLSRGTPNVRFEIDDAAAGRRGLARSDVALALLGRTRGIEVGQYRAQDDPVPILVRDPAGDETTLDALQTAAVGGPSAPAMPLGQLASTEVVWRPAAIRHRNRERVASVFAQVESGVASSEVIRILKTQLADIELPEGVELTYGGEAEGSSQANAAMLRTLPLGLLVLIIFLMAEFNSFRRVGIILVTVPLALVGVIPGLVIGDQPFGFMSLLGVIALVGVVVNNAIVLLDLVETRRKAGAPIQTALSDAVRTRTRPILLTTATTVAGLTPLAFSGAALWPPLAWAMITGLIASTALTLLVVPALYRTLIR